MRPFNVDGGDQEGKEWFIAFLQKRGYTVSDTDNISKFMHFDILATKGERTYWFELKNRDCYSYTYGDIEINQDKYTFLMGAPDKAILVYFWKDRWTLLDVKNTPPTKMYDKFAQHSHRWNRGQELKHFVLWDIKDTNIHLLDYDKI